MLLKDGRMEKWMECGLRQEKPIPIWTNTLGKTRSPCAEIFLGRRCGFGSPNAFIFIGRKTRRDIGNLILDTKDLGVGQRVSIDGCCQRATTATRTGLLAVGRQAAPQVSCATPHRQRDDLHGECRNGKKAGK
eukprot:scaffold6420_cov168-Amphora_coffeaeformis.AAC.6